MTRTLLVLDLPTPAGVRVVIVDDEAVVNECLVMVLHRFGTLVASGPVLTVSGMFDSATPYAHVSEIVADQDEPFAVIQKLREPDGHYTADLMASGLKGYLGPGPVCQPGEVGFEIFLTNSTDAVDLALSIADSGILPN